MTDVHYSTKLTETAICQIIFNEVQHPANERQVTKVYGHRRQKLEYLEKWEGSLLYPHSLSSSFPFLNSLPPRPFFWSLTESGERCKLPQ